MPSFTVLQLVNRAKSAADMHDDFVDAQAWIDRFNNAMLQFDKMRLTHGYINNNVMESITANGAYEYSITDPLAVLAVFESTADGRYRRIEIDDPIFGGARRGLGNTGPARYVRIYQNTNGQTTLEFWPRPQSGGYAACVIPQTTRKTALTDTVNIPNGWEQWMVCHMAKAALGKEETVNPALDAEMMQVEGFVEESVMNQLFAHAKVRNLDHQRHWSTSPFIPSRENWYII